VDDIDGTIDDTTKIYSMAGSEEKNPAMSTPELIHLVRDAGFRPIERDTLYNILNDYGDKDFSESVDIPVLS
jgi:aminodeoxyfutalosine synthase